MQARVLAEKLGFLASFERPLRYRGRKVVGNSDGLKVEGGGSVCSRVQATGTQG